MRFRIKQAAPATTNSVLVYRPHEYSFDVTPDPPGGFTSFLLDDLSLEVDAGGKIISVWGMCPHTRWVDAILVPPKADFGEVFVEIDAPLQRGVSPRLTPAGIYLPTAVDRSSGWVQIQGATNPASAVMIIPGVVFEIGAQGEFCSLWLRPQGGISRVTSTK